MQPFLLFISLYIHIVAGVVTEPVKYDLKAVCVDVDAGGIVYAVSEKYNLIKIGVDNSDTQERTISVANYGSDALLDASNPLEIFVFYHSTGKAYWFDNQLNHRGEIDIFSSGVYLPRASGRGNDGNIWVVDGNSQTLKKLNRTNGITIQESVLITAMFADNKPVRVYDNGELIAFQDHKGNVFVFDQNLVIQAQRHSENALIGISGKDCVFYCSPDIRLINCRGALKTTEKQQLTAQGHVSRMAGKFVVSFDENSIFRYQLNNQAE